MSETRPVESIPRKEFHQVVSVFAKYDELAQPYWQATFLQSAIDHEIDGERINKVEDGYLVSWSGDRFRLADENEMADLKTIEEDARITAVEELGIEPDLFDDLHHIVGYVEQQRSLDTLIESRDPEDKKPVASYLTGSTIQPRSMDKFLASFKALSDLTGETFYVEVMENMITIMPDEPIEVIEENLADSFRKDSTLQRFQSWNKWAADRYKESPESWPENITRQIDVSEIEKILNDRA